MSCTIEMVPTKISFHLLAYSYMRLIPQLFVVICKDPCEGNWTSLLIYDKIKRRYYTTKLSNIYCKYTTTRNMLTIIHNTPINICNHTSITTHKLELMQHTRTHAHTHGHTHTHTHKTPIHANTLFPRPSIQESLTCMPEVVK